MLYSELVKNLPRYSSLECVSYEGQGITYRELLQEVDSLVQQFRDLARARVAVYLRDSPRLIASYVALDRLGTDAYLISGETGLAGADTLMRDHGLDVCLTDQDPEDGRFWNISKPRPQPITSAEVLADAGGRVILFTSGTSGRPKGAVHSWRSLAAGIRRSPKYEGARWLVTYGLTRFAGLQVFLQTFLNGGRLTIPAQQDVMEMIQLLQSERIENVSGTPTFWRKLLTGASVDQLRSCCLKQITLGGEIVNQGILNGVRHAFPQAQVTHIYASTEMGACFSVKDGLEGFPTDFLKRGTEQVALRVQDGELFIRSSRAMTAYVGQAAIGEGWFATGDLVEVRDDRVYFLGRKTETINVGGNKVHPAEVEEEIRKVPGVLEVRVRGQKSSFVGQLVSADIVAASANTEAEIRERIAKHCAEFLPAYKRPRLLRFVSELPKTDSQKIVRQDKGD